MSDTTFKPAQVFHVAEFIADTAVARGWSRWDFAERIGALNALLDLAAWELYAACAGDTDKETRVSVIMDDDGPMDLERVFGISAEFWRKTEAAWRANPDAHTPLSEEAVEWFGLNDEVSNV